MACSEQYSAAGDLRDGRLYDVPTRELPTSQHRSTIVFRHITGSVKAFLQSTLTSNDKLALSAFRFDMYEMANRNQHANLSYTEPSAFLGTEFLHTICWIQTINSVRSLQRYVLPCTWYETYSVHPVSTVSQHPLQDLKHGIARMTNQ